MNKHIYILSHPFVYTLVANPTRSALELGRLSELAKNVLRYICPQNILFMSLSLVATYLVDRSPLLDRTIPYLNALQLQRISEPSSQSKMVQRYRGEQISIFSVKTQSVGLCELKYRQG